MIKEYSNKIKNDVNMDDIFNYISNFEEEVAESDLKYSFEIYWINNKIIVEFCNEYYSSLYNNGHDVIKRRNKRTILTMPTTAENYADMLIEYFANRTHYIKIYGENIVNSIHFTQTKYARIARRCIS